MQRKLGSTQSGANGKAALKAKNLNDLLQARQHTLKPSQHKKKAPVRKTDPTEEVVIQNDADAVMVKDEGEGDGVLGGYQPDELQTASHEPAENQVPLGETTQEDYVEVQDAVFNEQDDIEVEVQGDVEGNFDDDDEV